ncbi:MAG: substrate-binding domain-containing protein [Nitrospinota bacterium]|nr:substrate-binding domain-containing protein [Nitrospinota bacterium]
MTNIKHLLCLAAICAALYPSGAGAEEQIRIAGDPCTIPLAKKLGEAFTKKTGMKVVYEQGLCRSGVSKVIDGKADIGVSTFNFSQGQLHDNLLRKVIGKAPIVMVVNKSNQVNNLTKSQLHDILMGKIRNWSQLGGKDLPVRNVMLPPCVVETMTHQTDTYGGGANLSKIARPGNPMTNTNMLVSENEGAIGMQLYGYDDDSVKVLRVDGVLPDADSLPGLYGYYENYNVITALNPSTPVKKFIEFTESQEGRVIMAAMKHVPGDNVKTP